MDEMEQLKSELQVFTDKHGFTAVMFAVGELMRDLPDSEENRTIADAASHLDNACLETAIVEGRVADLNDWVGAITAGELDDINDFEF